MLTEYAQFSVARLTYLAVPINRLTDHCLSFWYYFGGGPVGSLLLYVMTADDDEPSMIWHRDHISSLARLSWLKGSVTLPAVAFPVREVCQLMFVYQ